MRPKTQGILEFSLYVTDVARSAQFYARIFGFRAISDFGARGCAMEAGNRQVLLLSRRRAQAQSSRRTTAMASFISRSRFVPRNWRGGKTGWRKMESRSKRNAGGSWEARAFIFAIQTGI